MSSLQFDTLERFVLIDLEFGPEAVHYALNMLRSKIDQ
jgi:hypothetical protein